MKNILYTIILSFLFSFSVFADWGAAQDAYDAGDYKAAFRLIKPLAEQGDAEAQFNLALAYRKGPEQSDEEPAYGTQIRFGE